MDPKQLEKYSSAITLSDMEVFVFPELMYSLVLANIMSPILWKWRDEDCFKKLQGKSPYKKLMRLRQYIMDQFEFNLDLNTWGLTHKDTELERFKEFISPKDIAASNALFGYEGDKYYFDVDIRRHFGLDQYQGEIIPYWKTETVEAMNAFRFKDGYNTGAGECVSLSTLYAAAAFVVCGIPLEDIYMVLTPLHSQNFIDIQDGVLTNNRRLVTKSMWFNGTEISNKAQRALRNEQVTIVTHSTGYVHCFYDHATIDPAIYQKFTKLLDGYLSEKITPLNFANFLRSNHQYQKYFQFCRHLRDEHMFVRAEVLFGYEHGSKFRIADATFDKLLGEVSDEDFSRYKFSGRLCCEELMRFVEQEKIDIDKREGRSKLSKFLSSFLPENDKKSKIVEDLLDFLKISPKLPLFEKAFNDAEKLDLTVEKSREEIIEYLQTIRNKSVTADLAFYAYRDMETCDWAPFMKAAIERNPVSVQMFDDKEVTEVYDRLKEMENESIYDGKRLAQPDEVVNFARGDGAEKAVTLANIITSRDPQQRIEIILDGRDAIVKAGQEYRFQSKKCFSKKLTVSAE